MIKKPLHQYVSYVLWQIYFISLAYKHLFMPLYFVHANISATTYVYLVMRNNGSYIGPNINIQ